ncbi:MAG: hypothetical protein GWN58_36520 [Anaerolineae bacterium]|nr:hypothetical protein [Anaerolineae bacterium]
MKSRTYIAGNLQVEDWAHRFPYPPPPAIETGPVPVQSKWTPILPTKKRRQKRKLRRRSKAQKHLDTMGRRAS